jgi:hypothetical protein
MSVPANVIVVTFQMRRNTKPDADFVAPKLLENCGKRVFWVR